MDSQQYMPLYIGIIEGEIPVNSPLLIVSQNNSISSPEVEITTSNKPPRRGSNISVEEDNILVLAWLNTSIDDVHGNELKQERFWAKIWQYFCQCSSSGSTRTAGSLQSQWEMINRETSRFCGFIAALEATPHSGTTEILRFWCHLNNRICWLCKRVCMCLSPFALTSSNCN